MYYKQYGNTDMKVSAVGLGTMRYDEEDIKAGRFEKCAEIPLYAFEKGINYWESDRLVTGKKKRCICNFEDKSGNNRCRRPPDEG